MRTHLKARVVAIGVSFCVGLVTSGAQSLAAASQHEDARAIIGTYDCAGYDGHQKWRFTSRNSPWGPHWVRVDTVYPAQNGSPVDIGETFVGFDPSTKRWNIIALDYAGTYYTRQSRSRHLNGSVWNDNYPSDGKTAVIRVPKSGQYTFDLYSSSGNVPLFHVLCSRR